MGEKLSKETAEIMDERFGCDTLLSVATVEEGRPFVRIVNSYYEDGAFYVVTYAKSNKMRQIAKNPAVAICGEWFTAHGTGENLGHVRAKENEEIMSKLRTVFAEWYATDIRMRMTLPLAFCASGLPRGRCSIMAPDMT